MNPRSHGSKFLPIIALGLAALATRCGGGGGGVVAGEGAQALQVSISPDTASVSLSTSSQFTATVLNATNTAVTWSISPSIGTGAIDQTGKYTAPAGLPSNTTVTITTTSQQDTTKSASATVTITSNESVSVTSQNPTLNTGAQQPFTATVSGSSTNTAVTWSAVSGTINPSSGFYTAPANVPPGGTDTITAASNADPTKKGTVTVVITSNVTVSVSPQNATLNTGAQQPFTVTVSGSTNTAVTWSAVSGTINASSGLYTAPSTVPAGGTDTVTATSSADPTRKGTATIVITSNESASGGPQGSGVDPGQTAGGPTAPPPIPDQISSVNQAQNAGFETGDFTDWKAGNACESVVNSQHHSGSYAAEFSVCPQAVSLTQSVTVPAWGGGSPAQYPEALAISFWVKTDANFNGSLLIIDRWMKGYWSAGTAYNPAFWSNHSNTMMIFANEPWTKYTAYVFLDPTAVSGSSSALTIGFYMVNNGGVPAGNLWLDDVTYSWSWSSVRTFLTYPNYKGLLWDDKPQIITGVTELTPKVGTTSATSLAIKLGSDAGCASPITTYTISTPTLFDPTLAYPQVQTWSIDTTSLGLSTGTAYYVCTTATWSDSSTTTYPDFMVVPYNHALRANFGNYVDTDGAWVHKGNRQVAWGTFDNWSGTYRTGNGLHTTWCVPPQSPPSNCYVYNIQSFGNWSPSVVAGIPGLTYKAPFATSGVMADYEANGFTWVEDSASIYSNIDPTLNGANELTPLLEALDQYGVANSQIMNSYWGSIASSTRTGGAPSSPTLSEVPGGGTFTSGTYVFVQITGLGSPGGSGGWAQMGETLPTSAVTLQIANSNDSVRVTLPACLSSASGAPASQTYRWAGFNVYAATNAVNTPPASLSFYIQNFGGPLACGGSFTFGSIAQPGQADSYGPSPQPPASDTTINAGFNLRAYTDWEDWQQFAYAQSVADGQSGNHGQGAAAEYVLDEPVLNWLGDGYYFVDAQRQWAPDVLTWATNNDNRTNRYWRDLFDVISSDPYGYNWVNSDEVYAGGTDVRTAYMPGINNAITKFHAGVGLVDYWADFNGRTTYGARPQVNVISLLDAGGVYGYSYPEMRRQYYKAMIGCQAWGGLGCGVLSYGWVEGDGLEDIVFRLGSTNTYDENLQALKEIEALTPEWLTTTADTSVLSIGAGKVDGASGLSVINRSTGSGPGLVLSNVKIGTSVSTVCAGGYTNTALYPFGPVRFVTKQMSTGYQYIIATNLCSAPSNFNVTFTLSNPPVNAVVELYGNDDPPAGSAEDPNGQYGNGTPSSPSAHARTFTLTGNSFTDSWRDEDVHVYMIHSAH